MVLGEIFALASAAPHSAPPAGLMAMIMAFYAMMMIPIGLFSLIWIASLWKIFDKAGEPGWHALIPILNLLTMLKVVGKPPTYIALILLCGPGMFALKVILDLALAERFGKDTGYAVGLILVPVIFLPMLAFGSAQYTKPAAIA